MLLVYSAENLFLHPLSALSLRAEEMLLEGRALEGKDWLLAPSRVPATTDLALKRLCARRQNAPYNPDHSVLNCRRGYRDAADQQRELARPAKEIDPLGHLVRATLAIRQQPLKRLVQPDRVG